MMRGPRVRRPFVLGSVPFRYCGSLLVVGVAKVRCRASMRQHLCCRLLIQQGCVGLLGQQGCERLKQHRRSKLGLQDCELLVGHGRGQLRWHRRGLLLGLQGCELLS